MRISRAIEKLGNHFRDFNVAQKSRRTDKRELLDASLFETFTHAVSSAHRISTGEKYFRGLELLFAPI